MAGELKLNNVSVGTESGGTVTIGNSNVTFDANTVTTNLAFAADHAGIKTALNASGSASVYACRAWAKIQANGTIIGSNNVSSVSASSGSYTVNFSNAMPDTNYSVCLSLGDEQAGRYIHYLHTANTGSVLIKVMYEGGNYGTYSRSFTMAIFR